MPARFYLAVAAIAVGACSNVSSPDTAVLLEETKAPPSGGAVADFGKSYCMAPPKDPTAKIRWMDDCISDGIDT